MENSGQISLEQKARDLLERMEVPNAQSMTAGELVELANLMADRNAALEEAIKACEEELARMTGGKYTATVEGSLARCIAAIRALKS